MRSFKSLLLSLLIGVPLLLLLMSSVVDGLSNEISRRDAWNVGLGVAGGIGYGKILGDTLSRISRGMAYPDAHECRVKTTIRDAFTAAASGNDKRLRILEVGIGSDCRLIRRGLYDNAFAQLHDWGVSSVEIVGVDVMKPKDKVIQQAKDYLKGSSSSSSNSPPLLVDLTVLQGDITDSSSPLSFPSGSFDVVISCLTLCSVADQTNAVERIRDLIRPRGGCLGYIEHVAVDRQEPYRLLEWQQNKFDPLQQALADNCHLHRYTEQTIASVFGVEEKRATTISEERFLVDTMWPVSCQACGVIQRNV